MKILFVAPYPPYPPRGGGQQRIYQFIRHVAREHEVWLLALTPSPEAALGLAPLHDLCHVTTVPTPLRTPWQRLHTTLTSPLPDMTFRGRSPTLATTMDELLRAVPFDLVQCESIEMAQYAQGRTGTARPLYIYDAFNAEFVIQQRAFTTDVRYVRKLPAALYSLIQWRKLRRYESRLTCRFGGVLAVSDGDAAILQGLDPLLNVDVVPNGVDTTYFRPERQLNAEQAAPMLLFTGTLDYRANIDAVRWFVDEVLPLVQAEQPQVRFSIVGRNPLAAVQQLAQRPGVDVVGEVDDVRPWFNQAAAYVVPMRIGGGVRLKVLEALAMEQPVISTSMGAEGITGLIPNTHALLADNPATFARQILRVLKEPELARQLGETGRSFVEQRYDWRVIAPHMMQLWQTWLNEPTDIMAHGKRA